jgi:ribosomal protein S18 acetylase RimI-like enzyme
MNLILERAASEDAAEILTLQKLAYQSEAAIYDDFAIPPLTQTLEEIVADLKRQTFLKATMEGRIVGSVRAYLQDGTCFVGRLIVHPSFQNQGIGTRLLGEIERAFDQAERFELFTGHLSERNLYLYQKLGYRPYRNRTVSEALTLVHLEKLAQAQQGNHTLGGTEE